LLLRKQIAIFVSALFEEMFTEGVMCGPQYQICLGIKGDDDKWNDVSDKRIQENIVTKLFTK